MRSASDAKLAKSDDSIDGAIFAATPILEREREREDILGNGGALWFLFFRGVGGVGGFVETAAFFMCCIIFE